eukprot:3487883-Pleurochrysis_carterae.AAC.1
MTLYWGAASRVSPVSPCNIAISLNHAEQSSDRHLNPRKFILPVYMTGSKSIRGRWCTPPQLHLMVHTEYYNQRRPPRNQ